MIIVDLWCILQLSANNAIQIEHCELWDYITEEQPENFLQLILSFLTAIQQDQ
ncbi:hypothetical protein [Mucilaginibacter lacusdianchii]|uniref:hypothetical protein n=1 Tax=Mucilaginibacter lacusdianchii TaxID=2684211 RepID=UPI00131E59F1|nr:hypothetical protein [Mucilaginibacter sp. JXJ CY 39]